jgi:hypothetical protein
MFTRGLLWSLVRLAVITFGACWGGGALAQTLTLVNPNQHDGVFPVFIKIAPEDVPSGELSLVVGGKRYPAARLSIENDAIVALVPMPELGSVQATIVPATAEMRIPNPRKPRPYANRRGTIPAAAVSPMVVSESGGLISVSIEDGTLTFGQNGIAYQLRGETLPVNIAGKAEAYRVEQQSAVCTVVASPSAFYLVWRDGRMRVYSKKAVVLQRPTPNSEIYVSSHATGLRACQITGDGRWIFRGMYDTVRKLTAPREWFAYVDNQRQLGLWVKNAAWDAADTLDFTRATVTSPLPSTGEVVLDLAPIRSVDEAEQHYRTSMPLLAFQDNTAEVQGYDGKTYRIEAEDANDNGIDLRSDHFTFYQDGTRTCRLQCQPHHVLAYLPGNNKGVLRDEDLREPRLLLEDWNRDGRYFDGPLFTGGFLQQDRFFMGHLEPAPSDIFIDPFLKREWHTRTSAYDLDGDGDSDINAMGHYIYFDLEDRPIGHSLMFNPWKAVMAGRGPEWYIQQRGTGVSWGSTGDTRAYRGHWGEEGESQLSFNFEETTRAPEAKVRMTGENWGNYRDLVGLRWNRFVMANLDKKSDVELNGHYSWDIQFQTGREIQDYNDNGDCFRFCNMFTLKDKWGHEIKLRNWEVPPDWDGKKITWRYLPKHQTWEMHSHAPWKGIAVHWYPKLLGIFEAEDVLGEPADEGMEPWALSFGLSRRWEPRLKPKAHGEPITIYYSPLMGAHHFKGAAFSHVNAPASWAGTTIDWAQSNNFRDNLLAPYNCANLLNGDLYADPYRLRLWGGLFLCAWDTDADDYFDTYLYDESNDGLIDRVLACDVQKGLLELVHADGLTAWSQTISFTDQSFLLENYKAISEMYRKGYKHDPMVSAVQVNSAGQPTYEGEAPACYVTLSPEWLPKVGVDTYHGEAGKYDWTDFGPSGLLRLGGEFSQRRCTLVTLDKPFTHESLAPLQALVIARFDRMLTQHEAAVLDAWLHNGGRLLVLNPTEGDDERLLLNDLIGRYGIRFTDTVLEKRTERWRQPHYGENTIRDMRYPAAWNRVTHFSSDDPAVLQDVKYLSFVGATLSLDRDAKAWLAYDTQPIIGFQQVGKGEIIVCAASFGINKYLCFPTFNDGSYTENRLMLQRLADRLIANTGVPKVHAVVAGRSACTIELSGRGGTVRLPAIHGMHVKVNGRPVALNAPGVLSLPGGSHRLEIAW